MPTSPGLPDSQGGARRHPRPCNRLHVKAAERLQDSLRNADETEWLTHTNCSPTNPGWFSTNVLLVDGVDTSSGPRLAGTLILEPGNANLDMSRGSLGPLFSRSTEIVGFLRCGVGDASVAVDSKACG